MTFVVLGIVKLSGDNKTHIIGFDKSEEFLIVIIYEPLRYPKPYQTLAN